MDDPAENRIYGTAEQCVSAADPVAGMRNPADRDYASGSRSADHPALLCIIDAGRRHHVCTICHYVSSLFSLCVALCIQCPAGTDRMFCGDSLCYAVANGLLQPPVSVIPTICGMITYYFLNGIMANETSLSTVEEDEELIRKFQEIIKQFAGNREMYLSVALLAATAIIVYVIRRLSVDYSWTIAIVLGMLMQFLGYFIGYMEIGMSSRTSALVIGCLISTVILFLIQFLFFSLDYMRTERVQFEDDEYYYYVKAVPKSYVATREKKVKKISSRNKRERDDDVSREELMSDMDIYMDDEED